MSKTFRVIVADPPWPFSDKLKMSDVARGAEANYKVMSISDIEQLPIKDLADPEGTVLALWVPSTLLQEGLDTMKAWGFKHKQTYIWVKTKKHKFDSFTKWIKKSVLKHKQICYDKFAYDRAIKAVIENLPKVSFVDELAFGMGRLFRQSHEICLIGINNNKIYGHLDNKSQRSVSFAENLKHSAKPEELQDSLDEMFPNGSRLELFARRIRPNWICLGNEVCNGEDIRVSLAKL
jgi:N6-adenosine-specific RNA methylase IME4